MMTRTPHLMVVREAHVHNGAYYAGRLSEHSFSYV